MEVIPHVKEVIDARRRRGISSITLRGLFYQNRYKGLSRKLVEARERGEIDPDSIVDESRTIIDINDSFYSPEQLVDNQLDVLESLPEVYKKHYIPRWLGQPHYVEAWVEKKAMAGVLKSILAAHEVRIVPTGGWASFTYERNNLKRLKEKIREGKKVHILYLGDYDPSGLRMDEKMIERYWNEYGIDLRRIAITREQIRKFGLQHLTNPDPEVLTFWHLVLMYLSNDLSTSFSRRSWVSINSGANVSLLTRILSILCIRNLNRFCIVKF